MDEGTLRERLSCRDRMAHDGTDQRVHVGFFLHEIGVLDEIFWPGLEPETVRPDDRADGQLPRRDQDHRSRDLGRRGRPCGGSPRSAHHIVDPECRADGNHQRADDQHNLSRIHDDFSPPAPSGNGGACPQDKPIA
jgi:hypothetical protein